MYKFERNSRIYMGQDGQPGSSSTSPSQQHTSSRPSSRSPQQGIIKGGPHHRSNTAIHTTTTQNGLGKENNCNGGTTAQHSQTKSLRESQHRAISSELGDLTAPGETKTKTQMARAFQESQELYKSADQKAGLQTVKTRRVLKKTTTITRGENEKLEDNNFREILLRWAQRTTDGYPGCRVTDLTTSWRDGLAFNAIIHRNRPDLLDYRGCRKKTSRENLDQAFTVADRDLGCARLLEPEEVDVPVPDEKSMITYLAQLYELFPDPPERNPLLDEEKIRRINEYKDCAGRLLKWIRDSTGRLEDRRFPKTIPELKKLKSENELWKAQEVPPKQQERQRLAAVAPEIYRLAQDVNVLLEKELHMDNIDHKWEHMMNAHRARNQALDDEIAKAERLRALLEKLLNDIRKTNERLDGIEREMVEGEQRVARMQNPQDINEYSAEKLRKISDDLADVGIKIDSIKRLANDFINEAGRTHPDSVMVREKVAELDARYKRLLGKWGNLQDQYDRAIRRLKEMEDAHRRAQKEAEAKLRLKLEAMKRELDELEYRIDNMGPVAKDLPTLRKQLEELNKFDADLGRARKNLNDLIELAEDMIRRDLIVDPVRLRTDLQALKDQLARIEEKAARRLRDFEEALRKAEAQKEAEAKFRLKLDAMKRELDELEQRLDNMGPVAKDLPTLRRQLVELDKFDADLNRARNNLNDLVRLAEDLIRDDLIGEPAKLRQDLQQLKDQLARIEEKRAKRLADIQGQTKELADWLDRAKRILLDEENVHGDLDTVNCLLEQHKAFQDQLGPRQASVDQELSSLVREKSSKLNEALRLAEQLHKSVHSLLESLADSETKLKSAAPLAEDEQLAKQELAEHENLLRRLQSQAATKDQTLKMARDILQKCHPDAEPVIKHWLAVVESRWEAINEWAQQRGQRIRDHLKSLQELLKLVEDLIGWLTRQEARLLAEETEQLPDNANQLNSLLDQHSSLMDELRKREPEVDRVCRVFASKASSSTSKVTLTATTTKQAQPPTASSSSSSGRLSSGNRSATPTRTSYATYRDEYPDVKQARAKVMLEKWRQVWQLCLDITARIKDRIELLEETGRSPQAGAELLDGAGSPSDDKLIQDELQRQLEQCKCSQRFKVYHVGERRYRFGESQKLRLVRVSRSSVMVRVGGGWEPLATFLQKNDPCRGAGHM